MRTAAILLAFAALPLLGQTLSGRRAPSFSLPDSNQAQHDILDYRGKWLLLDFIKTTGCSQCATLSKELQQIDSRFSGKIAVLSILLSPPENSNTAAQFVAENKLSFPIVFDQSQVAIAYFRATPSRPGIDTPHLFAINPKGEIVQDWSASRLNLEFPPGKGLLEAEIERLMARPASSISPRSTASKKKTK